MAKPHNSYRGNLLFRLVGRICFWRLSFSFKIWFLNYKVNHWTPFFPLLFSRGLQYCISCWYRNIYISFSLCSDLWPIRAVVSVSPHATWAVACPYPFSPQITLPCWSVLFLFLISSCLCCCPCMTLAQQTLLLKKGGRHGVCVCACLCVCKGCHADPSSVDTFISFRSLARLLTHLKEHICVKIRNCSFSGTN